MFTSTKDEVVTDLKTGASNISREARNTAQNVKSDINRGINNARDHASSMNSDWEASAQEFGGQARRYFDEARSEIRDTAAEIRSRITRNPIESSLVALAAGFVLGQLFRR